MKKYLILICILLISINFSFAQYNEYKNQLKFAPVRIFDVHNPGIEVSYQRNYSKSSTQFSAAYLVNLLYPYNQFKDMNGLRLSVEEKFYLKRPRMPRLRLYISAELAYHNVSYFSEKRFYLASEDRPEDPFYNIRKEFAIKRDSKQINCKFGLEFRRKRFVMEGAVGLGLLYNNVKYKKNADEIIIPSEHFEDIISPIFETEGKYFAPNIQIIFKTGYNF